MSADEHRKPKVTVIFRTKDVYTTDSKLFLRRLKGYNRRLKTNRWKVLNYFKEGDDAKWIFRIDKDSASAIHEANYTAYTGVDRGNFALIIDLDENLSREELDRLTLDNDPEPVRNPFIDRRRPRITNTFRCYELLGR